MKQNITLNWALWYFWSNAPIGIATSKQFHKRTEYWVHAASDEAQAARTLPSERLILVFKREKHDLTPLQMRAYEALSMDLKNCSHRKELMFTAFVNATPEQWTKNSISEKLLTQSVCNASCHCPRDCGLECKNQRINSLDTHSIGQWN